jgi:hypothetical protein
VSKEYFNGVLVFGGSSVSVHSAFDGETAHEVSKDVAGMTIFKQVV